MIFDLYNKSHQLDNKFLKHINWFILTVGGAQTYSGGGGYYFGGKDLNFSFMMKRLFNELNEEKASTLTT